MLRPYSHLPAFFSLISFILLDSVFSISGRSCHTADSSHVGRLWGARMFVPLPMAGPKYFLTVSPHGHISKVRYKLLNHLSSHANPICVSNLTKICFSFRLPNPIYLGTLIAGILHSLLCFYGRMIPNILYVRGIQRGCLYLISWRLVFVK